MIYGQWFDQTLLWYSKWSPDPESYNTKCEYSLYHAMLCWHSTVYAIFVCLSSVCHDRYCIKIAKPRITQTMPHHSLPKLSTLLGYLPIRIIDWSLRTEDFVAKDLHKIWMVYRSTLSGNLVVHCRMSSGIVRRCLLHIYITWVWNMNIVRH